MQTFYKAFVKLLKSFYTKAFLSSYKAVIKLLCSFYKALQSFSIDFL